MKYILFVLGVVLLISCQEKEENRTYLAGNAFGTEYHIKYFESENYEAEVDSIINAVNQSVSTYLPTSDISMINKGSSNLKIDDIFKKVFMLSQRIHKESNGYFDPTVGVLRNAYGFGEDQPLKVIDSTVLDSLQQMVGLSKIRLTPNNQIRKENKNIYLDFNAIAKGYGIDLIGMFLESKGIHDYIIELGGEIRVKGKNTIKDKNWLVGIEGIDSQIENRSYNHTLNLKNESLASSGNYRKFRVDSLSGNKYVHTINPITGQAEQSDITSASVIAKTCAEADAYATTLMAMGYKKSLALLGQLENIEAYFTYLDRNNQPQEFMTEGFRSRIVE